MKLQKWTIKQVLFEREMYGSDDHIVIYGFKLPREKDFLLQVLEELYGIFGDKWRIRNTNVIEDAIKHGTRFVEVRVNGKQYYRGSDLYAHNIVIVTDYGLDYYPDPNKVGQGLIHCKVNSHRKSFYISKHHLKL